MKKNKSMMEFFKLEDRVLFEAAAAAEIVEAQENDPNANMNQADQQAQDAKNAIKNAPPESLAEAAAAPEVAQPDKVGDIDAQIQALVEGEIGFAGAGSDVFADAVNGLLNDFGADAVSDTIHDAFAETQQDGATDVNITVDAAPELVVINSSVKDVDQIISSLGANQEVLILENGKDAMAQINDYLNASGQEYSAIHVVSHGNAGYITLAGERFDASNFDAAEWAAVGEHLTADGDILFYGCNLAENEAGQDFIAMVADASGADVAASTDATGISGNWVLEYTLGNVNTTSITVDGYDRNLVNGEAWDYWELVDAINAGEQNIEIKDVIYFENTIQVKDGQVITINGSALYGGNITKPMFDIVSGNITFDGITIDGGDSAQIMTIGTGGTVHLVNTEISNGAANFSGAISNSGTLTIEGGFVSDNNAVNDGGAICNLGTLTIDGTTFENNTAGGNGGAIFNSGILNISNAEFRGNVAEGTAGVDKNEGGAGGAIYTGVNGGNNNSSSLALNSVTFTGNYAKGSGGAIFHAAFGMSFDGEMVFENNTAEEFGGAICFSVNAVVTEGTSVQYNFEGNEAEYGGAIASGTTLSLTNAEFAYNTAYTDGGAIWSSKGTVNGSAGLTLTDSNLSNNYALENGGGIYLNANSTLLMKGNSSISDNYASGNGGGIYAGSNSSVELNGTEVSANKAYDGGGIYLGRNVEIYNSGAKLTLANNASISDNIASRDGGGIYAMLGSTLSLTSATISGNFAGSYTGNSSLVSATGGNGGGIWSAVGFTIGSNVTISGNTARAASGNVNGLGGGIYMSAGTLTLDGAMIGGATAALGNKAYNGGGIYLASATVNATAGTFQNNQALNSGGGIYTAGNLKVSNLKFFSNSAVADGGGIFAGSVEVYGSQFGDKDIEGSGNSTTSNISSGGGAIYGFFSVTVGADSTGKRSEFYRNTAGYSGGAIYGELSVTVTGAKFGDKDIEGSGNSAVTGGAISAHGPAMEGKVTIDSYVDANGNVIRSEFYRNSANGGGGGGAIYSGIGMNMTVKGAIFGDKNVEGSGNTASLGGAIWTDNKLTVDSDASGTRSEFYRNSAEWEGGAIFGGMAINITVKGAKFGDAAIEGSGNSTQGVGGAIDVGMAVLTVDCYVDASGNVIRSEFYRNSADLGGGAISAGNATIIGAKFGDKDIKGSGNTTVDSGGAIGAGTLTIDSYLGSNGKVVRNEFYRNSAVWQGGAISVGGTATINGAIFGDKNVEGSGNTAKGVDDPDGGGGHISSGSGGAIYAVGELTIDSDSYGTRSEFYRNSARDAGGAISTYTSLLTVKGAIFGDASTEGSGNTAKYWGGAISAGTLTVGADADYNRSEFYRNGAITDYNTSSGGAIFADKATIIGAKFGDAAIEGSGNISIGNNAGAGGAIYAYTLTVDSYINDQMEVVRSEFYRNSATSAGAIYTWNATIKGAKFGDKDIEGSGNSAEYDGGAIYATSMMNDTMLTVGADAYGNRSVFYRNTAMEDGGAIFAWNAAAISNADFAGNIAGRDGGAIHKGPYGEFTISNSTITGNYAGTVIDAQGNKMASTTGGNGGGISSKVDFTVDGTVTITGNTARAAYIAAQGGYYTNGKGGGIYMGPVFEGIGAAKLTLNGATINGNNAYDGGGVYIASGGALEMTDSKVIDNIASHDGGGIYSKGALILTSSTISGNYAGSNSATAVSATGGNGGGIYSEAALTLNNVTVSGNTARANSSGSGNGGGIYMRAGTLTLNGATIGGATAALGNKAISGGGSGYLTSGGGVYLASGALLVTGANGGTFRYNYADNNGGGLYAAGTVTVSNLEFFTNSAMFGGGIYGASVLNVFGSKFGDKDTAGSGNNTSGHYSHFGDGGAIYAIGALTVGSSATGKQSEFYRNTAYSVGGAIYGQSTVIVYGAKFGDAEVAGSGNSVYGSSGEGSGGAIYSYGALTVDSDTAGKRSEFYRNTGSPNIKSVYGGAISGQSIVTVYGAKFGDATIAGSGNTSCTIGGAIYSYGALTVGSDATGRQSEFYRNTDSAIYGWNAVTVNGAKFGDATIVGSGNTGSQGGAIYAKGTLTIGSNTAARLNEFYRNTAENSGGAIYGESAVTVYGAKFGDAVTAGSGNVANWYGGGAIYVKGALTVGSDAKGRQSEFYRNTVTGYGGYGGAIYAANSANISNSTFTGNIAGADGGAIYKTSGGMLTISGSAITGNFAGTDVIDSAKASTTGGNGGGIWSAVTTMIGSTVTISENIARADASGRNGNGGGIYITGAQLTLQSATIGGAVGNQARNGGGIYLAAGAELIGIGKITNNIASGDGGGVYAAGTARIEGMNFYGNKATGAGGGLFGMGDLTVRGCDFGNGTLSDGNTALLGGGIYSTGTLDVTASRFSCNVANAQGGAIYSNGILRIDTTSDGGYSEFWWNTANMDGGAIYGASTVTVDRDIFGGNRTLYGNGGAIYSVDNLMVTDSKFQSNLAYGSGGGIYANNAAEISNSDFTGNIAGRDGGAIYKAANGAFTITDSTITGNFAGTDVNNSANASSTGGNGGGIYSEVALSLGSGMTVSNNIARAIYVVGNYIGGNGGGIYGAQAITLTGTVMNGNNAGWCGGAVYGKSTVTVIGAKFGEAGTDGSGNISRNCGGAIYAVGEMTVDSYIDSTGKVVRSEFYRNIAQGGGAIYAESTISIKGAKFGDAATDDSGNTGNHGGAILATAFSVMTVDSDASGNRSEFYRNSSLVAQGGAISAYSLTLKGAIFGDATEDGSGNTADGSGGAVIAGGALLVDSDAFGHRSEFYRNTTGGWGGAIYACSTAMIKGAKFGDAAEDGSGNTAKGYGGAIFAVDEMTVDSYADADGNVFRSEFYRNTANGQGGGGAIFGNNNLTVKGAIFGDATENGSGNAAANGGAICTTNSVTVVERDAFGNRSEFYRNSASNGGAIYTSSTSTLTVKEAKFGDAAELNSGNKAGLNGGAIYAAGDLMVTHSEFRYNQTNGNGGGIYAGGTKVNMDNTLIVDGSAVGNGGGIYFANMSVDAVLTNLTIANNTAAAGGGIYAMKGTSFIVAPSSNIRVENTILWGNKAGGVANQYVGLNEALVFNSGIEGWGLSGNGNINLEADNTGSESGKYYVAFENLKTAKVGDRDYHLSKASFAINRGNNAYVADGEVDLDGKARIQMGIVDMGAYESGNKGNLNVTVDAVGDTIIYGNEGSVGASLLGIDSSVSGKFIFEAADGTYIELTGAKVLAIKAGGNVTVTATFKVDGDLWNDVSGTATVITLVRQLTITGDSTVPDGITYDGQYHDYSYTVGPKTANTGLVFGDQITGIDKGTNSYRNAGTYSNLQANAVINNSADDTGNYIISYVAGTVIINKATLVVNREGVDKVYDGNTNAQYTFTGFGGGYVAGDNITYNRDAASASFADKNVGNNKAITITGEVIGGTDLGNYIVSYSDVDADITKATLVVNREGVDKVYNGNTDAQYNFTGFGGGYVAGDNITYNRDAASASFADKNVGNNKAITIIGEVIGGSDLGNYIITYSDVDADITKATLVVNREGVDKVYDGNTNAQYNFTGFGGGYVAGDNITYNRDAASASFADKNVGENKAITITGEVIGGSDLGNYIVTYSDVDADITKATLTVDRTGVDKVYDGNTSADYSGKLNGVFGNDDVTYIEGSAMFGDKNVGENKALTFSGEQLYGSDLGNYSIVYNDKGANITKATLTITAASDHFTYDSQNHSYSWTSQNGLAAGDRIADATVNTFRNAGTHANALTSATIRDAANADMTGNYELVFVNGSVVIDKAVLTVDRTGVDKVYDGNTSADYSGKLNGAFDGDKVTYTEGSASFGDKNVGENKTLTFTGEQFGGDDLGNYEIVYNDKGADITKATLTITGASDHRTYDGKTHSYSWTAQNGLVDGDKITDATTNTFRNAGTHTNALTDAAIVDADGADMTGNYELVFVDGTVIIDKAVLVIDRDGVDKTYDGTTDADYTFDFDAFEGDKVEYNKGDASFNDKNAGTDKAVNITGDSLTGEDATNYDVVYNDSGADINRANLIIVIDDKGKTAGAADPAFTGTATGLVGGDTVDSYNRTDKSETAGRHAIDQFQLHDDNGGQNYNVTVVNGTLTITAPVDGEARINIYMDAASKNYVINGMDHASLVQNVSVMTANREADAVLDTETSGNANSVSHQTSTHAGEKAKSNFKENSQKKQFEEADQKVVQQRTNNALKTDIFSEKGEKSSIVESQYKMSGGKGNAKVVAPVSEYSSQNTSFESDNPMHTMPSDITIEATGVNVVNFHSVDFADVTIMEKADNLKDKLDIILEEMITV